MDSNDPINEAHKDAGEFARTGVLLVRKLQAEGWTPAEIEYFSYDSCAEIRARAHKTIRENRPSLVFLMENASPDE
ncbi:MAG TPA: hypothetical protein VI483_03080 [Candidatus Paceibacterota bacterium]